MPTSDNQLAQEVCDLLFSLLDPQRGFEPDGMEAKAAVRQAFVWVVVWSIGANIADAARPKFGEFILEHFADFLEGSAEILRDPYGFVPNPDAAKYVASTLLLLLVLRLLLLLTN